MAESPLTLVIGGTGMLRPAVHTLLDRGEDVAVLARRPERGAPAQATPGRYIPVAGDWSTPSQLADGVVTAVDGRTAGTVIVWVHEPHRTAVLDALRTAIAPDAAVVHIWGSASRDPRETISTASHGSTGWRLQHVTLGYRQDSGTSRWLTAAEISTGVLTSVDENREWLVVGQVEPWDRRP